MKSTTYARNCRRPVASAWRRSKPEVDVLGCLRLMVFNRLCDPGSKLGVLRWLDTVALPVGVGKSLPQHQHLLRCMDVLDEYSPPPKTSPNPLCGLRLDTRFQSNQPLACRKC